MSIEITGNLMDMLLVDLLPITGNSFPREFLVHFGPQAASCGVKVELGSEEVVSGLILLRGSCSKL